MSDPAESSGSHALARRPTVVLLHGLLRTERSMSVLRGDLDRAGFPTWACTYPSRRRSVADCARYVDERLSADGVDGPLVAVTHSMGGIVVRHLLHRPWLGAVMLAPPSQGSQVAQRMRSNALYRWLYGPAGHEMGELSNAWPVPAFPTLVIAGSRRLSLANPTSWLTVGLGLFPTAAAHDGTVALAESAVPGNDPPLVVDASHTWVMNHPEVRRQVLDFVRSVSPG